jgi:hypothetical protein
MKYETLNESALDNTGRTSLGSGGGLTPVTVESCMFNESLFIKLVSLIRSVSTEINVESNIAMSVSVLI